jgi:beta-1,4-N-acetylglucosaminyltransferase
MMNIISELQKDRFTPRYYVAALTDNMSLPKAQVYEWSLIPAQVKYLTTSNYHMVEFRSSSNF